MLSCFPFSGLAIICFVEWGLIHVAAFVMIAIPAWSDNLTAVYGAYDLLMKDDSYKKEYAAMVVPRLAGKIIFQHGCNLGWCGIWSGVVVPLCIVHHNRMAWVMTLVPWLADVGYFCAFDLFKLGGGMAQAQTYIVSIGSILTAASVYEHHNVSHLEFNISIIVPSTLIFFGLLEKAGVTDMLLKCFHHKIKADYDAMAPRTQPWGQSELAASDGQVV